MLRSHMEMEKVTVYAEKYAIRTLLGNMRTRKRAIAKALHLEGHSDFAPVDLAYYQHFQVFWFENIAF